MTASSSSPTTIRLDLADVEDAETLARLELRAFDADTTSILAGLIWPKEERYDEEQVQKRVQKQVQSIREELKKGERVYVKALLECAGAGTGGSAGELVGFAAWLPPGKDKLEQSCKSGEDGQTHSTEGGGETFKDRMGNLIEETRRRHLSGEKYWYLAMLTVEPKHWRRGIGRRLVEWGLQRADEESDTSTFLEASLMAEAFYRSLGFDTIGWDALQDDKAPDGVCKWPYMKREARRRSLRSSSGSSKQKQTTYAKTELGPLSSRVEMRDAM